ncbi:hypothetical protein SEA_BOILGATE_62 [Mycobacterium phage Boilgate]|nr:hypothetical protein SEA_BOILGATE_62 [Mycobacterium phage Boilgate]
MSDDVTGFFNSGVPSAKFKNQGDTVGGRIVEEPRLEQQRDYDTGAPLTYDDGNPRMQLVITLQTDLRDPAVPNDDGQRRLYVKGAMKAAIGQALRVAGVKKPEVGGDLHVTYTHDGEQKNPRLSPPKQFSAVYTPPSPAAAFFGNEPAAPQPTAAAPQPTAAAPQPASVPASLSNLPPDALKALQQLQAGQQQ